MHTLASVEHWEFVRVLRFHRSVAEDLSFWDVKLCCLVPCSRLPFETSCHRRPESLLNVGVPKVPIPHAKHKREFWFLCAILTFKNRASYI